MMTKLDSLGLGGTVLNIRQGFSMSTNSIDKVSNDDKFYELMQQELNNRQTVIDSLRVKLAVHKQFSDESISVSPEIKVLFPTIKDIALSHMVVSSVENAVTDTVNMIFVNAPGGLDTVDRNKLIEYLEVRLNKNNVYLTVNPSTFPWPSKKTTE